MSTARCTYNSLGVVIVCLIAAVVAIIDGVEAKAELAVVDVPCSEGYEDFQCAPGAELTPGLNWCNVAHSGLPDQYREDDRERVLEWIQYLKNYEVKWRFSSYWETDTQRDIRVAAGGWITCENKPGSRSGTTRAKTPSRNADRTATPSSTLGVAASTSIPTSTPSSSANTNNGWKHDHPYISGIGVVGHGGGKHRHSDDDNDCVGNEHEGESQADHMGC